MPRDVGREELLRLLDGGAQLVEVLPKEEYDEEHLPGAINIPLRRIDEEGAPRPRPARGRVLLGTPET